MKKPDQPKGLKHLWDPWQGPRWREGPEPETPEIEKKATKPGLHALPIRPLFLAGEVMRQGALKHGGTYNYRAKALKASMYYDALLRHLARWWERRDVDEESGMPHLAHVICNAVMLLDCEDNRTLIDDRPPSTPSDPARL